MWNETKILSLLAQVKLAQGLLLGKMQNIGFAMQDNALLQTLTEEILKLQNEESCWTAVYGRCPAFYGQIWKKYFMK